MTARRHTTPWRPNRAPKVDYAIDVRLNRAADAVDGRETVSLVNPSDAPIESVLVEWADRPDAGLDVGPDGRLERIPSDSGCLVLHLGKPIEPGELRELKMSFRGPADVLGWYPRLTWGVVLPFDRYVVKADAPDGAIVITSGRLNERTGAYESRGAPCFGLMVRDGFGALEKDVDGVLVQAAYAPETEAWARHCFDAAADVIRFYTDWIGFYPSTSFWMVPALDKVWGGGPQAPGIVAHYGAVKFAERTPDYWTYLTAHEIGHQYWGEYVLTNYVPWPDTPFFRHFEALITEAGFGSGRGLLEWLPLGMGIYMDRRYARARDLDVGPPRRRMRHYLDGVRDGIDTALEGKPYPPDVDYNNIIAHGKGFAAISAFAAAIGHDAFQRVVRRCLAEFGGRRVTSEDLQRLCEEEIREPLDWLFDAWVRTNQHLGYEIAATESIEEGDGYSSTVLVRKTGTLRMPIPVEARFADGSAQRLTTDRALDEEILRFRSDAPLEKAILDPDRELALIDRPRAEDTTS